MAQRVNIALPDELHQRLQRFKDNLNVSSICQEALERVVDLEEIKENTMSQKEKAIAKLRIQAQNESNGWFQEGKKEGLEAALNLDYKYFVTILEWVNSGKTPSQLPKQRDEFNWMIGSAEDAECPESLQSAYINGIIEGILEFWNEVKDEVRTIEAIISPKGQRFENISPLKPVIRK